MSRARRPLAIELVTERFVLKPLSPGRLAWRTFDWTKDKQSFADMTWRTEGWTPLRWWRHLRRQNRRNRMAHSIWPKGADAPIGLHLVMRDATGAVVLGILVGDRAWWGKGVVVEIRTAVLDDCFGRLGARRASGTVSSRNFASIYNYQRLGFVNEGTMRQSSRLLDGTHADQLVFGLLREEWLASRAAGKVREDP